MKKTGKITSGFMVLHRCGHAGIGEKPTKKPQPTKPEQQPEKKPKAVRCPAGYLVEEPMLPIIPKDIAVHSRVKARKECDCPDCRNKPQEPLLYKPLYGERSKK